MIKVKRILILLSVWGLVRGNDVLPAANCSQEIAWMMENITDLNVMPYISSNEMLNSGHYLNNLGLYDECRENTSLSYSLLKVQINLQPPTNFYIGVCSVSECKSSDLQQVKDTREDFFFIFFFLVHPSCHQSICLAHITCFQS